MRIIRDEKGAQGIAVPMPQTSNDAFAVAGVFALIGLLLAVNGR